MTKLHKNIHYLQVSINSNTWDAQHIIGQLPPSDRIIIEVGTPLIKQFGQSGIQQIVSLWRNHLYATLGMHSNPYIVADLKCMDRAETESQLAYQAGATAAVVLGQAPIETINSFITNCKTYGIDSVIDMMNIAEPYKILRLLPNLPDIVMLHRGVDETNLSKKPLPIHLINKVKGTSNVLIAVAGGDTDREVQSSVFNGADIVVVWKDFYGSTGNTSQLASEFLKQIK